MIRFKQRDRADCGPAALAWLASLHGRNLSATQIRLKAGTTDRGTSIQGMLAAASELGFEGRAYRVRELELRKLPCPHIAYVRNSSGAPHYVVVRQVRKGQVVVLDPEGGVEHKLTGQEYAARSLGAVILIRPRPAPPTDSQSGSPWHLLWEAIMAERTNYGLAVGCGGFASLLAFSLTIYLRVIVDYVIPFGNLPLLRLATLAMGVILVLRFSVLLVQAKLISIITHNLDVSLFIRFTDRVFGQPQSLRLGGLAFGAVVAALLGIAFFALKLAGHAEGVQSEKSRLTLQLNESFARSALYRALGLQDRSLSLLAERFAALGEVAESMSRRRSQLQAITGMLPMMISIGVLLMGTLAVMDLELSVGRLFAVYATAAFIAQPLVSLAGSCGGWAQAFHALVRLHEMVTLPHEESGGAFDFPADEPISIEYQSVALPPKNPAPDPKAISFIARPGTLTVLLGHSPGIANALVRPIKSLGTLASGRILINGIDLKEYDINRMRCAIAWAPSKADLLRGTLLENLTNWDAVPNAARIKDLCAQFDLWELLLSLPKGLHTEIGHGSYLFNPAARRLLTLIRAFYQTTGGIVLEDPTLNLGSEQRRKVCSYIRESVQCGMCIIVATHDRDLAEMANQVVTVGDGGPEPRPKANPQTAL
ncbi:MAG: hypothetical protein HY302_11050 [Opitutae bacterium]|nr:hypothetical protein [Opitutae bacterium]